MTDSFPATERTPCLSCDMSGALGKTLLRRYEELAAPCFFCSSNRSAELIAELSENLSSRVLASYSELSCFPKYMSDEMDLASSPNFLRASPVSDSGSTFLLDVGLSLMDVMVEDRQKSGSGFLLSFVQLLSPESPHRDEKASASERRSSRGRTLETENRLNEGRERQTTYWSWRAGVRRSSLNISIQMSFMLRLSFNNNNTEKMNFPSRLLRFRTEDGGV